MTEKIVTIGGKAVKMRASALIPRLYRFKFGRDLLHDMRLLEADVQAAVDAKKKGETAALSLEDCAVFEQCAWIMAKHADPEAPELEEWLSGFDGVMDIYMALPDILELWHLNKHTTSIPVKK